MDQYRVLRGGCYSCAAFLCRSSFRTFYGQDASMEVFGFRVAFTQPAAAPAQE
jgi:formylglycine-generating enzyme required for sulfatase activity